MLRWIYPDRGDGLFIRKWLNSETFISRTTNITELYILTEMLKANGENTRFQNINANICTNLAENIKARVMDEISKKVGKQKV